MNIYIVHSGCDKEIVMQIIEQIENREPRADILMLRNGGLLWKAEATRLLKKSQMVLFIVGAQSHISNNIAWELKQAIRYNKLILYYKLDDTYKLNTCLYGIDQFSKKKKLLASEAKSIENISDRVKKYENSEYAIFNGAIDKIDRTELLEQYKIFLETSESLVARRQTVNSFYVSANTALITIMATLITAFKEINEKIIICGLISFIGIILSISWNSILNAYGILNSSKMKVISMIEHELPASLYDTEWDVMSDKLNSKKYTSFTDSEKKAPKAFIILYILLIVITAIFCIRSFFN